MEQERLGLGLHVQGDRATTVREPTARQLMVCESIWRLTKQMGHPPSLRELAADLGLKSISILHHSGWYPVALRRKGLLREADSKGRSRTLVLTDAGNEMAREIGEAVGLSYSQEIEWPVSLTTGRGLTLYRVDFKARP